MAGFTSGSTKVDFDEQGIRILTHLFNVAPKRARRAFTLSLYRQARLIMKRSKEYYVPVGVTGNLRASGTVKRPVMFGDIVLVEMGYGGAAKAYAEIQHENEELSHPPKNRRKTSKGKKIRYKRAGRAKYLSTAVEEQMPYLILDLAYSCDDLFQKAGLA